MKIKIKENAQGDLARLGLCGKWVEVDTRYLFNNQYNLKDYNLRVMDQDVSAVQDDERPGKVKCGYCGEMFDDREELETHYLQEEANAHNHVMEVGGNDSLTLTIEPICQGTVQETDYSVDIPAVKGLTFEKNEDGTFHVPSEKVNKVKEILKDCIISEEHEESDEIYFIIKY